MTAPRDPSAPDVTIHTGGALWPTPGQLRAELPEGAREEFEVEYGRALDHARGGGDPTLLAHVLVPRQWRLVHHRNGDYEAVLERARRIREGDLSGVVRPRVDRLFRAQW
ncbi:DUF6247 family protein [Embleya sp. NBC_00888]|uniref:DUF6247 family protein n=1 Tax=Embleya sp. NBC_00888 TaxID=2975960 RepID=UPI00386F1B8B|nr:DUF6247 family protein [Embleya sp. NBC_00888]